MNEVCARVVAVDNWSYSVEVTAPAGTYLHNAHLAPVGVAPCAAGEPLVLVGFMDAAYPHGPLSIEGTHEMRLRFARQDDALGALDLEVRGRAGFSCVRVSTSGSGPSDAGHGG